MAESNGRKRGRKPYEEIRNLVREALRMLHYQDYDRLNNSQLASLAAVNHLVNQNYRGGYLPIAFAIRELIEESVNDIATRLDEIPRYQREVQFLQQYIRGVKVTEISRDLELSRGHVHREIQRPAFDSVTEAFLLKVNPPDL